MKRTEIPHQLTTTQLMRRIERELPRYARQYGLSSRWASESLWVGKRKGLTVKAWMRDGSVQVEVDGAWYMPEGRIVAGIRSELNAMLERRPEGEDDESSEQESDEER